MRIALITDTYAPQVNGVSTVVRRIADSLRDAGHAAAIVAPQYPRGGGGDRDELRIPSLPFPPYPSIRISLPYDGKVSRFLDGFAPDLVHVATEGPLGRVGRRYALRHERPLVTSFHTHFPAYARHYGAPWLAPVLWRWLVRFHRAAQLIHTPGEAVWAELQRRGLERAVIWGRGVDVLHFRPYRRDVGWRRWLAGADGTAVVLHVGRLAAEKNLNVLVESWTKARAALGQLASFVIAGDGPYARSLVSRLPFVRQLGFLDLEALARLYASADLCVLPSETETCGLVALEAMASGLPVIAADAGGLRERIRHDLNGLLVPARDAHGFCDAIVALVRDADRRRVLGRAARLTAESRDVRTENQALLRQYAALTGAGIEVTPCAA
ncbi:MAG: glycosyltransferase family 4 protein [Gemmatimonadales bacterium]